MSAVTHEAANHTDALSSPLRSLLRSLRTAIEAHAAYRVRSVVSPSQLQQTDREIRRYRRLMKIGK
jgi:hypothetical protein